MSTLWQWIRNRATVTDIGHVPRNILAACNTFLVKKGNYSTHHQVLLCWPFTARFGGTWNWKIILVTLHMSGQQNKINLEFLIGQLSFWIAQASRYTVSSYHMTAHITTSLQTACSLLRLVVIIQASTLVVDTESIHEQLLLVEWHWAHCGTHRLASYPGSFPLTGTREKEPGYETTHRYSEVALFLTVSCFPPMSGDLHGDGWGSECYELLCQETPAQQGKEEEGTRGTWRTIWHHISRNGRWGLGEQLWLCLCYRQAIHYLLEQQGQDPWGVVLCSHQQWASVPVCVWLVSCMSLIMSPSSKCRLRFIFQLATQLIYFNSHFTVLI